VVRLPSEAGRSPLRDPAHRPRPRIRPREAHSRGRALEAGALVDGGDRQGLVGQPRRAIVRLLLESGSITAAEIGRRLAKITAPDYVDPARKNFTTIDWVAFAGFLADRYGARRVLWGASAMYALGLLGMAYASTGTGLAASAGLLAGDGPTAVREPAETRDHTERMLPAFGVPLRVGHSSLWLRGAGGLRRRSGMAGRARPAVRGPGADVGRVLAAVAVTR